MKPISQLITQPSAASEQPTQRARRPVNRSTVMPSGLTETHIDRLWERMTMVYGYKWTSAYGTADDGTWLVGLGDVTPEQVGMGSEKCRTSAEPWPPTLPEFRAMCLPARRATAAHSEAAGRLPAPRADKTKALEALSKIREAIA